MSSLPDRTTEACLKLHVFRVHEGLGNACLLEFPDQTCGILDWGTDADGPLKKVLDLARHRLRFVAATHAHSDHTLGLQRLLIECSRHGVAIEKFVYPATTLHDEHCDLTEAFRMVNKLGIESFHLGEDSFLAPRGERQAPCLAWAEDGAWDMRVLGPPLPVVSRSEIRSAPRGIVPGNETSLVLLFRFLRGPLTEGVGRALLTGDATPAGLSYARRTAKRSTRIVC